ncbi:hypothetical protein DFH09DRAFT_1366563 [Mycena vulgaris]|nr:hypothetical protein DFH09DRAFT_1366563 [Mycena vulgaris]
MNCEGRPGWVNTAGWLAERTPEVAPLDVARRYVCGLVFSVIPVHEKDARNHGLQAVPPDVDLLDTGLSRASSMKRKIAWWPCSASYSACLLAPSLDTTYLAPSLDLHSPAHARSICTASIIARPYISASGARRNRWKALGLTRHVCMESPPSPARIFSFIHESSDRCCLRLVHFLSLVRMHPSPVLSTSTSPSPAAVLTHIAHTCIFVSLGCDAVSTSSSVSTCPRPVSAFSRASQSIRYPSRVLV